jgi:hypothetical protein
MTEESPSTPNSVTATGSLDGQGAADHDQPFDGFHAYRFSTRQVLGFLQLRSDALEARLGSGRWAEDLAKRD